MLVEKALDKDPAARYQSTRDLAVDLRRLIRPSEEGTQPALPIIARQQRPKLAKNAMALVAIIVAMSLFAAGVLLI